MRQKRPPIRLIALLVTLLFMCLPKIVQAGPLASPLISSYNPPFAQANTWDKLQTFSAGLTVSGGVVTLPTGSASAPSLTFSADAGNNTGLYLLVENGFAWTAGGAARGLFGNGVLRLSSDVSFGWSSSGTDPNTAFDLILLRDAANTLGQRNGTNAQVFNLYNTFTDASNYERGFMRFTSNILRIGAESAGTGTARNTEIIGGTGTTSTLTLQSTSGVGAAGADIIFKVGNNGATEAGRALNSGKWGFGIANPARPFHIHSTAGGAFLQLTVPASGTDTSDGLQFIMDSGGADAYIENGEAGFMALRTSAQNRLVITGDGNVVLGGQTTAASLLDLRAGDLTFSGANGQKYVQGYKTELTTIAAAATTATTITIPANAILKAVMMRVTVQPPGTATMVVTATTSGTVLQQGANMSTAINTTDVGTRAYNTNYVGVAAQTITITPNVTPSDATGRVRFDIYFDEPTAATS